MVYRGKPSKACEPCRRRKLVCDLKERGCSSCRRAKLICHGYRDTESLRIADETSAVQRRIQGPAGKSEAGSMSAASRLPEALVRISHLAETIPQSLDVPTRNQARDLFYYNYVFGALKPFEFLQSFYSPIPKEDHLTASMDAVALAYLNYQQYSPKVQTEARQHYITALRLMNKALGDPKLASKDSTILAILLLDLYEKVTNKEPHYEGAWAAHLQGALTLVSMRGQEQFDDPMTVRILLRVSTNQIISCIATHRPVPEDVIALRDCIAGHLASPTSSKQKESDLMIEYARLRYKIENEGLQDEEAILLLKALDNRFCKLLTDVRATWQFKTVETSEKSVRHWESHHHIYPCEQIAQVWNVLRVTRILLNELLLDLTSLKEDKSSNLTYLPLHQQASETIVHMISDICAAVPQYIGDSSLGDLDPFSAKQSLAPHVSRKQKAPLRHAYPESSNPTYYLPCYRLIFPLYIAVQSPAAPPQLKPWVIRQLRFMADHHGIENAAHVADILQSGEIRDPWHIYAMLGSYAFVC
jgi:hypothetical protein